MSDTRYDQIPYKSFPFPQAHPDRLATIATLFGMRPPLLETCRVLELGCASGGNLIPMAERFPQGKFLGIDASRRHIQDGQVVVKELGLRNIELHHEDILQFDAGDQEYDYIIAHGVWSWVPDAVQNKMLEICRTHLAPQGLAYISYNTYPGWHLREMIREIMKYRARSFDSPAAQLNQARGLLAFLSNSVSTENNPYGMLLKQEVEALSRFDDYYLQHEHLEEVNTPLYFHQFAERAEAADLQYLGEADFGVMSQDGFPDHVRAMLQTVSRDLIETEQYMDFLRNRSFRQTILCRRDIALDRLLSVERLLKLRVASDSVPDSQPVDLNPSVKVGYRRRHSVLNTSNPLVKAALHHLSSVWPNSVPFVELASIVRSSISGQATILDADVLSPASRQLAETLIRCYATAHIDLHVADACFVREISEKPQASALARRQAAAATSVTNRRHEMVQVDDFQRNLLTLLDGTRTQQQLIDALVGLITGCELVVYQSQRRITDAAEARHLTQETLPGALQGLARAALLVPSESSHVPDRISLTK